MKELDTCKYCGFQFKSVSKHQQNGCPALKKQEKPVNTSNAPIPTKRTSSSASSQTPLKRVLDMLRMKNQILEAQIENKILLAELHKPADQVNQNLGFVDQMFAQDTTDEEYLDDGGEYDDYPEIDEGTDWGSIIKPFVPLAKQYMEARAGVNNIPSPPPAPPTPPVYNVSENITTENDILEETYNVVEDNIPEEKEKSEEKEDDVETK